MSSPRFWFLAAPEKGLATLDHEGQRFVPVFVRMEDLQRFGQRCADQLSGYRVYIAAEPPEITAFLEMLQGLSVNLGLAGSAEDEADGAPRFAILEPAALAHALTERGTSPS